MAAAAVKHVAGALLYTRYNIFKRWIMKRIVAKAGGDTDVSRDYDYTDSGRPSCLRRGLPPQLLAAAAYITLLSGDAAARARACGPADRTSAPRLESATTRRERPRVAATSPPSRQSRSFRG